MSLAQPQHVATNGSAGDSASSHEEKPAPAAAQAGSGEIEAEGNAQRVAEGQDVYMSKEEYRTILRKLDWAILPLVSLLYLLSFLDRVNIGQAAVAGLKQDLNITTGNLYAGEWITAARA